MAFETVGDLREALRSVPDETPLCFADDYDEFICTAAGAGCSLSGANFTVELEKEITL